VVNVLSHTDRTLSELIAPYRKYHGSGEVRFRHDDPDAALQAFADQFDKEAIDLLDGVTVAFPEWWCNVRKDGDPAQLCLCLEANTGALLGRRMSELAALLGDAL